MTAPNEETVAVLRLEVAHLRELLYVELAHRDQARELQAREYERRLETLNHENARILTAASLSVSNEKFDGFAKAYEEWKRGVDRSAAATEASTLAARTNEARLRSTVVVAVAVATLVLGIIVAFLL